MTTLHYMLKDGQIQVGEATITIRRNRELDLGHYVQVELEAPREVPVRMVQVSGPTRRCNQGRENAPKSNSEPFSAPDL